ncbi:MAG: class I SAM-dependent methyltransferase [Aeromicrobium sp.]
MVSVNYNKKWWGQDYDWSEAGDEWSAPWGGPEAQWYGSLYPRIHRFLPTGQILEIACGYGRWTQFLREECEGLTGVDLSDNCIEACRERFADDSHLRFLTNDGTTVPEVADASIDFIFSFDSLVHADPGTLAAYMHEFRRVLKPEGVAFIHHSNLGGSAAFSRRFRKIPKLPGALRRLHVLDYQHGRDFGVCAEFVAKSAEAAGLRCIGQEIIPWTTRRTWLDCISLIVPEESPAPRENRVVKNRHFKHEAGLVDQVASIYGPRARS